MKKPARVKRNWMHASHEVDLLLRFFPNAKSRAEYGPAKFNEGTQVHITVAGADPWFAAQVTFALFGEHVSGCGCSDYHNFFLTFFVKEKGDEAIRFYNRLPNRMTSYKGDGAHASAAILFRAVTYRNPEWLKPTLALDAEGQTRAMCADQSEVTILSLTGGRNDDSLCRAAPDTSLP